jgi:hypothetical protein
MDLRDQGWPEKIGSGLALRQPGMEDIMGSAPGPCRYGEFAIVTVGSLSGSHLVERLWWGSRWFKDTRSSKMSGAP